MRTVFFVYALILAMCASFSVSAADLTATLISQSPCKLYSRGYEEEQIEETQFLLSYENGILTFSGINVWATCGVDLLTHASLNEENEIRFNIREVFSSSELPDCMCLYDIVSTYDNIKEGTYSIYIGSTLYATVDLTEGCNFNLTEISGVKHLMSDESSLLSIIDKDVLKIDANGIADVRAYDSEGRLRMKLSVEGDSEISLASLPAGIYMIMARSNGEVQSIKYLKK